MSNPLRIAIAGLGTVGAGTLNILQTNAALLAARGGRAIEVVAVSMRDASKKRDVKLDGIRVEKDARALANASDVDVVVEAIGGDEGIAREVVEAALNNKKHVVTANKALIAKHGLALAALAEKQGVVLAFEAAVAGGIPIIARCAAALRPTKFCALRASSTAPAIIFLTTMQKEQRDFADVLADAQKLGYAEADPSFDVDGIDTAHKVAILTSLAFGTAPNVSTIHIEGIRRISIADIEYAASFGYRIKLLGIATMEDGKLLQRVHPCLVPANSPLGVIDGRLTRCRLRVMRWVAWCSRGAARRWANGFGHCC